MYDERELTVEQIGKVLVLNGTSIYRALGTTTPPGPAATRPVRTEPVAVKASGEDAAATLPMQRTSVGGAPAVLRPRGRPRWFVVQADPANRSAGRWRCSAATAAKRR